MDRPVSAPNRFLVPGAIALIVAGVLVLVVAWLQPDVEVTGVADGGSFTPEALRAKLPQGCVRFFHIDGEHEHDSLSSDLELAHAVMHPQGIIALDDMLHPGYPTLITAVLAYRRGRHSRTFHAGADAAAASRRCGLGYVNDGATAPPPVPGSVTSPESRAGCGHCCCR